MYSPNRGIWKKLIVLSVFILAMSVNAKVMAEAPQTQAVQWRDTLYVRIADSVFLESDKALVFSLEIYRPNDDWNNDKVLGDFDFYFSYSKKAFLGTTLPTFDRLYSKIDNQGGVRQNLLSGYTRFYAGRYGICGRADNSPGAKFNIPLRTWVELCRVKIPMDDINQNPGIRWDAMATGAMTAGGNPIILKMMGDVEQNPKATVKAAGLHVMPELQCQGEDVYVYVRDAITSGTGLDFVWQDSVAGEKWNPLGTFNAASTVKTGSSKNGRYQFEILGEGDTLVIKNSPAITDGMFFQCTLTDASVGASMAVDTVVQLRDSLFGYFASTTPSTPNGMSGTIDTVGKCPELPANLHVYVFGPTLDELKKADEFGSTITVHYCYQDEDLNTLRDSIKIPRSNLLSGRILPTNINNKLKKDVFKFSWTTEHTGKLWVESIRTEFCNNGVGYPLYDTLVVREVEGDLSYNLDPLTVGVSECVDLDTARTTKKPYEIKLKNNPSLIDGFVSGDSDPGSVFSYCADVKAGFDTVYYEYTKGGCTMKAYRNIAVVENSYLTMKVLLEGPYQGVVDGRDTMWCEYARLELNKYITFPRNNVGKLYSPYDEKCVLNNVKFITDIKTPRVICDWIYVKLRDVVSIGGVDTPGPNYIDSVSAFVLSDGMVCGIDGQPLKFRNLNGKPIFVELKHRNHLKVITNIAWNLPTNSSAINLNIPLIDFTNRNNVWKGDNALKLWNGKYCLYAGDLDGDGYIGIADNVFAIQSDGLVQYFYDISQDDYVTSQDQIFISRNDLKYTYVP